ncbi:MAG: competence protein ComEC [Candidatus Binataceae bacterium]|nr:competence protein ComEC [Candidatus Binataceae bacterium]
MADLPESRLASSPLFSLAITIGAGIASAHYLDSQSKSALIVSIVIGIGCSFFSIVLLIRNRTRLRGEFLIGGVFFAGMILTFTDTRPRAVDRISRMYDEGLLTYDQPVELTGIVQGQPEPAPDSFYLTLRAERISFKGGERQATGTVLLLAHELAPQARREYESLELRHGARVRVMTTLDREENFRNPGVMPLTEYLEREGFEATGVIKSPLLIERLDDEAVFLPLAWVYEWREQMQREFAARFSEETAGVLEAALLGNRYNISKSAADRFRAGGTFHVLVISGLQIAFIGGLVVLIARALTTQKLIQFLISAAVMWVYAIAVGADPSVARAALMFTTAMLAPVVWRRASSLNVIGGAALALLVWQPQALFDPSFQLTFLSVLAIVLVAVPLMRTIQRVGSWRPTRATPYPPACPRWFRTLAETLFWSEREWRLEIAASNISYRLFKTPVAVRLESWHMQKVLRYAFAAILVSASVQIGLLPLMVIYFHRLSIASLALNIFVGIFMAALAFVALAALLLAHLSQRLASPLILIAEKIDWLMIHLVDPFNRFNVASIRLPHYPGWRGAVYVAYYILLGFLVLMLGRWNPLHPGRRGGMFSVGQVRGVSVAFGLLLLVVVLHPFSATRPDGKFHIDFLDVGQGDAALLTMPDGATLLVDGGGRPNINLRNAPDGDEEPAFQRDTRSIGEGVVSQYLWSRGMDRVDYILATHADADHIDGLNDVARNFAVRSGIVARTPGSDPEYSRFATTMREVGGPVERIGAGDVLRFGQVSAQVLWPPPGADEDAPSRNNDSIMLLIRYGDKTFLMTGDIEKEGEAAVLNEGLDLRSDLVKVAHHGSKTSSIQGIVSATRPGLAIISVGRTSMFGHPNKDVVERWRAIGAEVMTTGQRGTISVITDGQEIKVETFVK